MIPTPTMSQTFYEKAWDILVAHAGATTMDPHAKDSFVRAFLDTEYPVTEWRFCGSLGFGGKFWRNDRGGPCPFYVNCYREDQTKASQKTIEKVNRLLEVLYLETAGEQKP